MSSRSDYASALSAMYARSGAVHKLGLDNITAALELLGRPQERMRHVVVAGTNGKGSTSALIAGALRRAGHHVGLYTSPHLLRFTERIRIDGRELAEERVISMWRRLEPLELSFFEIATVMALVAFAEDGVAIAVLEVGLGGRFDATNVVDRVLSVITPISFDHQQYLGDTLAQIAFEKAGIIQAGVPVVVAPQVAEADTVVRARAARLGCIVHDARTADGLPIPPGSYQRVNVATAAAACRVLGVAEADIAFACEHFDWPGRFQWFDSDTLLDGAHNGHGVQALVTALVDETRPVNLIATVLADKDPDQIVAPLARRVATARLVPVASRRSRSRDELAALGLPVFPDIAAALADARAHPGFVLIAGSLFLVADALELLTGARRDPPIDG